MSNMSKLESFDYENKKNKKLVSFRLNTDAACLKSD